ncbi:uncharacterized protein LOC124363590 [Homalodisca vitripennis]|uniref:uncharacterized protein LOC124363590 n=1 Tax=Homalodisca vitripennis TaxID=197043 RepID=UPI001EEC60CB|nr:uncharacterized protein LOC124363590 [Homalodisca vitripennis]
MSVCGGLSCGAWLTWTERMFPAPSVQISCQFGGSRYDRILSLSILDLDDNLPQAPPSPVVLHWTHSSSTLGTIELLDLDSVGVNNFTVVFLDDVLDILEVHFTVRQTTHRGVEASVLRIEIGMKKGTSLITSPYNIALEVTDIGLPPPNKVIVPVEVRRPPPQSLSLQRSIPQVQYNPGTVLLSRAASLHARVAEPRGAESLDTPRSPRFSMRHPALNVTQRAGIVFVYNTTALRLAPKTFKVRVEWQDTGGRQGTDLAVELVDAEACLDYDHVDNLCSSLSEKQCVRTSCAHGLGLLSGSDKKLAKCVWVADTTKSSLGYSTCTAHSGSCPDDWCDPLERLSGNLTCLQDCTEIVLGAGKVNPKLSHGVWPVTSSTFCSCDHSMACSCTGLPSATGSSPGSQKKQAPTSLMKSSGTQTASVLVHTKATQTPQVNSTTMSLVPEPKGRRKGEGCGFKCQTKAAIGGIFVMSSCICFFIVFSSRRQKRKASRKIVDSSNTLLHTLEAHRTAETLLETLPPLAPEHHEPVIVPDPRWEFPRDSLVIEQCLGEGEFGRVLKARAMNIDGVKGETVVAVKTLKINATPAETADLLSEYQMMKDVSHPNVVRLLGACTSSGGPVYIIIEYAEHGSLRTYLRRSRLVCPELSLPAVEPVSYKTLLGFAWQISKGMSYLADNKLVHRDLAARNVLLATNNICKISDFGLSRDVYEDEAYLKRSKGRVPVKWMALESLADHVYTAKSDVWSYGVVLWELVTLGSSPYPGVAVHNLFHLLRAGYRMEQPHTCTDSLYELMVSCWNEDPIERPPFWQITARLEKIMEDGADYLPLQLEKRLVINRGYLAEFSPDDDFDCVKHDFNYKVPKVQRIEEFNQTSPLKRYQNEEAAEPQKDHYDSPRGTKCSLIDETSMNNLGITNYTVLRSNTSSKYQNDAQINIDRTRDKGRNDKESKYEVKKLLTQHKSLDDDFGSDKKTINKRDSCKSADGYVAMDSGSRRASSVDFRPNSYVENSDVSRRTSVLGRTDDPKRFSCEDNNEITRSEVNDNSSHCDYSKDVPSCSSRDFPVEVIPEISSLNASYVESMTIDER